MLEIDMYPHLSYRYQKIQFISGVRKVRDLQQPQGQGSFFLKNRLMASTLQGDL